MASPPSSSKMHPSPSKRSFLSIAYAGQLIHASYIALIFTTTSMSNLKGSSSATAALTASGRAYDAKLVQREMLRLGALAGQLPAAAFNGINTLSSSTAAVISSATSHAAIGGSSSSGTPSGHAHGSAIPIAAGDGGAWAQLHLYVLPLFNHEQLQVPIEDCNTLVRRHIEFVMSLKSARALQTLEADTAELISAGMTTLNTKLSGFGTSSGGSAEDDKLLARVGELWTFFWDQVLPYVEGVFIPLQTEPILLSLYRTPKAPLPDASPATPLAHAPQPLSNTMPIDVRAIALRAFRDKIVFPIAPRLEARLITRAGMAASTLANGSSSNLPGESLGYQHPRLQQMLLVLHSQAQRARPALSLTAPPPSLSPSELAIRRLLDALSKSHSPHTGGANALDASSPARPRHRRAPSFLSGGAPRDRRGRIGIDLDADSKRRGRYLDEGTYPNPNEERVSEDRSDRVLPNPFGTGSMESAWMAQQILGAGDSSFASGYGEATPKSRFNAGPGGMPGAGGTDRDRDWEREAGRSFLDSLKSPMPMDGAGPDGSFEFGDGGGDSLEVSSGPSTIEAPRQLRSSSTDANGNGQGGRNGRIPTDIGGLDWDSAQAVVERMVGMPATADSQQTRTPSPLPSQRPTLESVSRRRRMT